MRTSALAKAQLREDILLGAIPFLKESGASGAPVDTIMANVGLTSGALYSHFKSKDDFFNQVVLRDLARVNALYRERSERIGPVAMLESFFDFYLSEKHVAGVGEGCVFAALGSDLKRASPEHRSRYEDISSDTIEVLSRGLAGEDRVERMRFIFASMVGTIVLARTMKSKTEVRKLLAQARKSVRLLSR